MSGICWSCVECNQEIFDPAHDVVQDGMILECWECGGRTEFRLGKPSKPVVMNFTVSMTDLFEDRVREIIEMALIQAGVI